MADWSVVELLHWRLFLDNKSPDILPAAEMDLANMLDGHLSSLDFINVLLGNLNNLRAGGLGADCCAHFGVERSVGG